MTNFQAMRYARRLFALQYQRDYKFVPINLNASFNFFTTLIGYENWSGDGIDLAGYYYRERDYFMANFKDWKFVNMRLTSDDEPELKKFALKYKSDVSAVVIELLSSGYKISITWVDDKESFIVTLTPTESCPYNAKSSMSSWSDDVIEAVMMAGYKNYVLADGKDWADAERGKDGWG